jgi:hypothetical protein
MSSKESGGGDLDSTHEIVDTAEVAVQRPCDSPVLRVCACSSSSPARREREGLVGKANGLIRWSEIMWKRARLARTPL